MARINEIYKCGVCGTVVSVIEAKGDVSCCNEPMKLLEENTEENEKHTPVLTVEGEKIKVKVGSVEHPMEDEHWIELIQLMKDDKVIFEKRLYPGEKPEAEFLVEGEGITVRELCNLHGLWKS